MLELFVGLCTGFVLTIPPGPVAAYALETTLHHGQRAGSRVALGVSAIDTMYCLGVLFASSALVQWAIGVADEHQTASMVVMTLIVIAVLIVGVHQMFRPSSTVAVSKVHLETHVPSTRPFLVGAATALSNGFNPTFLPSLTAVITSIHSALPSVTGTGTRRVLFAGGFGIGTYLWLYILTHLVGKHKAAMTPALLRAVRRTGGVIFVIFASWLLWKMYS